MEAVKMSRLRQERIKRGWTLAQVAKDIAASPAALQAWETTNRAPSLDMALKLAKLYKVKVTELFSA